MTSPGSLKRDLVALLPRLQRYARNLTNTKADADDLLQATCIRALEKSAQFKRGTEFDRWTFTIMSSIRSNYLRAENIRRGTGLSNAETELFAADTQTENIFYQQVYTGVKNLPIAQRQVLLLVYIEGFTYQEAADMLDVPIGTIMSRIARGRAKLAEQFSTSNNVVNASSSGNEL